MWSINNEIKYFSLKKSYTFLNLDHTLNTSIGDNQPLPAGQTYALLSVYSGRQNSKAVNKYGTERLRFAKPHLASDSSTPQTK